ncbi:MAG: hypothetical protein ACYC8T_18290 [Myxococcaceae bacterium]
MPFKVGQETLFQISNLKSPAKEAELKAFDTKLNDGVLDMEEASAYVAAKTGNQPLSIGEAYAAAGGRQHEVKLQRADYWSTVSGGWAYNHKGDFHIDGVGAGNVKTGRLSSGADAFTFSVNCDLIDKKFVEEKIASANIMIGPKGFNPESGSKLGEQIAIPLNIATRDGYSYQAYSRGGGGGSVSVPDAKFLGAQVDVESLKKLAAESGGLSFYIRLDTVDGKTHFINKDGVGGRNFDIDAAELKPRGTP